MPTNPETCHSNKPDSRRRLRLALWLCALPVIGVAGLFAVTKAKDAWRGLNAERHLRSAQACVAQGEYGRAVRDARSAMESPKVNTAAVRVMAEAMEGAGAFANAAAWRSHLDSLSPGDGGNLVAWASDALKAGDAATASSVLSTLKPEPADDAAFHVTAAEVAAARRDAATAERHWAEAVRLSPADDRPRLRLAVLWLASKDAAKHSQGVAALRDLSPKPATACAALRTLLADAVHFTDWQSARQHADALVAAPDSTFADRLVRLDALRAMKSEDSASCLAELQSAGLGVPDDLYLLLMWMERHSLAFMASDWVRALPQDLTFTPPVCVAVATVHSRCAEWQRLREFLDGRDWAEWEYLRRAFLARALEKLGEDSAASAQEWAAALAAARSRKDTIPCMERLVRLVIGWGWEQRAQEVMWEMAPSPVCPPWILQALRLIAEKNADAVQLQKLAAIRLRADSKSVTLRNDLAFYSLLTRSEQGDPHGEAERLLARNPGDAAIAVTRALSLYQQGKNDGALAITAKLPAGDLQKPKPAFYHALFLTAKGDSATAAGYLAASSGRRIFPEEKSLLDRARQNAAKAANAENIAAAAAAMRAAKATRAAEVEKDVEAARAARAEAARTARAEQAAKESAESTVLK